VTLLYQPQAQVLSLQQMPPALQQAALSVRKIQVFFYLVRTARVCKSEGLFFIKKKESIRRSHMSSRPRWRISLIDSVN
jgi:hypothetical protein